MSEDQFLWWNYRSVRSSGSCPGWTWQWLWLVCWRRYPWCECRARPLDQNNCRCLQFRSCGYPASWETFNIQIWTRAQIYMIWYQLGCSRDSFFVKWHFINREASKKTVNYLQLRTKNPINLFYSLCSFQRKIKRREKNGAISLIFMLNNLIKKVMANFNMFTKFS